MTFPDEYPDRDPEHRDFELPHEEGEPTDADALDFDGVAADETDTELAEGDIEDGLPSDPDLVPYSELPGYSEAAHTQEIETFLDSIETPDAAAEVPIEDQQAAWQITTKAAATFLNQGPTYTEEAYDGDARTDLILSPDGTVHDLEVREVPPTMLDRVPTLFTIKIENQGDADQTGRGAQYFVKTAGIVTRTKIDPQPRDLDNAVRDGMVQDIDDAIRNGNLEEALTNLATNVVSGIRTEEQLGIAGRPIGPDEARRLAHVLLGREIEL